jgi:hypothetical protein
MIWFQTEYEVIFRCSHHALHSSVTHQELTEIEMSHIRLVNNNTTFTTRSGKRTLGWGWGGEYFHTCFTSIHLCQNGNTLLTIIHFFCHRSRKANIESIGKCDSSDATTLCQEAKQPHNFTVLTVSNFISLL